MNWVITTFSSSLGKKLLTALTGLFLCTFLVVHLLGNLQLFYSDEGLAFNTYARFMTTNPLIKTVSILLYSSILGHAFLGLYLAYKNKKARPVSYASVNNQSVWASRNMGVLGTMILLFIVVHMSDFWYEYHNEDGFPFKEYKVELLTGKVSTSAKSGLDKGVYVDYVQDGVRTVIAKDLFLECKEAFEQLWYVVLYVISMAVLAFHLSHGFQSGFQTLGLNHKKYTSAIKWFGLVFSILIPLAFAAIPVYMYFS
ncbi:MAG: succinate dehydrogenase cytochrome b subunit [Cytophagaceae bacterium]|jgi:succinate dehydrogenase / fumarate reductase cytochrome b subunit|nr:succinate dehydrogenase cytochrome b subunit [Cytophagaceae bacterium]